jgi:hypothetical protein
MGRLQRPLVPAQRPARTPPSSPSLPLPRVPPPQIVTAAMETKNVVAVCAGSEVMKNMLPHLLEQLELCQKSLSAYLETKRAEFPR